MVTASLNDIRRIIEARLSDEFRRVPQFPIVFHNVNFAPAGAAPYVQCLTSFGNSEYLTIGGTPEGNGFDNRIVGLLTVNVYTPSGDGPGLNFDIGERIRNLYNRAIVSGVYFDAPVGPEVLVNPNSADGFFQTQVRVTFEFIEET